MHTSDTSVTVTWRRLSIVEARGILNGYTVEYKPLEQMDSQFRLVDVGPEEGTVMITGLEPGVTYSFMVYASTAAGRSASDPVTSERSQTVAPLSEYVLVI